MKSTVALLLAFGLTASACASDPEIGAQAEEAPTSAEAPTTQAPTTEAETTTSTAGDEAAPEDAAPEDTAAPTDTEAPTTEAPAPVAFDIPSADLTNIKTGETVNLTSVADGKPLVLWFWAPH